MSRLTTILFLALSACAGAPAARTTAHVASPLVVPAQTGLTIIHTLTPAEGIGVRGAPVEYLDAAGGRRLAFTAGERGPNAPDPECSNTANWQLPAHTEQCPGSIVSMKPDGSDVNVMYAFHVLDHITGQNADGYHPYGSLALGLDGRLHGVAQFGGVPQGGQPGETVRGAGVAFSLDPISGSFRVDHHFFAVQRALDGEWPMGKPALLPNGSVCGTAKGGGAASGGTVWCVARGGVLRSAPMPPGSGEVYGGLTYAQGLLHGVSHTGTGGSYFVVEPQTMTLIVVGAFPAFTPPGHADDNTPIQQPLLMSDGTLFVPREFGGSHATGQLARVSAADGIEVLRELDDILVTPVSGPRFANLTGAMPNGAIVEGCDGLLYGTATYGGAGGFGGIYRAARDGSSLELLYSFTDERVGYPYGGLGRGGDCALYGVTFAGSAVYRFVPPVK
jgi:uncharacterized repeat protein (TIGR03803 family)